MLRTYPGQINDILELLENIEGENLVLVEIGSFQGESMELFASSGRFSKIYCVDPWENGYDPNDESSFANMQSIENEFDIRKSNYSFVEKIKMRSEDAVKLFDDKSIDMVYIDGLHTPEGVERDIKNWRPKVKTYITGHDWEFRGGLIQESIIKNLGFPDFICKHVIHGGNSDGSWIKKINEV